jgi:hypothetical protein
MAQRKFYYKHEDAEHLKQTFESWINKTAQAGKGEVSVLKTINIKPKKTIFKQDASLQTYSVEFQFTNEKAIDSSHFLLVNGLTNMVPGKMNSNSDYNQNSNRDYNQNNHNPRFA